MLLLSTLKSVLHCSFKWFFLKSILCEFQEADKPPPKASGDETEVDNTEVGDDDENEVAPSGKHYFKVCNNWRFLVCFSSIAFIAHACQTLW